ncbi:MAG: hypothetical protein K8R89_03330 [Anaerolineae bacterium]|nr:hypothetical protein [Anaerolineae bacterium]
MSKTNSRGSLMSEDRTRSVDIARQGLVGKRWHQVVQVGLPIHDLHPTRLSPPPRGGLSRPPLGETH